MAILSDHETMTQFILGLVAISLIFSGYLLFRIREMGLDIGCVHEGFHELFISLDPEDEDAKLHQISEVELANYILEFADHLGIPKYKKKTSKNEEEVNTSDDVSDWDSGTNK
jgi:hypothetical protein